MGEAAGGQGARHRDPGLTIEDLTGEDVLVLWAFNERHLLVLRDHVAATLRERSTGDLAATSMFERLPAWITSAKHRAEVLRTIERLKSRIPR